MIKQSKNKRRDLKDFIIEQIEKSGFTLERYAINLLIKNGWSVYPSTHFHDKDSDTDREFDVWAEKEVFLTDEKKFRFLLLKFRLLIECKKIPGNAWIFFPGPVLKGATFSSHPRVYTLLDAFDLEPDILIPTIALDFHYQKGFFSSGYTEVVINEELSNKQTNNLMGSIISIVKATCEEKNSYLNDEGVIDYVGRLKAGEVLEWVNNGSPMSICYVFPIVIFEGKMFSAKFPLSKENLNEASYVRHMSEYKSANYAEYAGIDIVEKRFLPEYVKEINNDIRLLTKAMRKQGHEVIRSISEQIVQKLKPDSLPRH